MALTPAQRRANYESYKALTPEEKRRRLAGASGSSPAGATVGATVGAAAGLGQPNIPGRVNASTPLVKHADGHIGAGTNYGTAAGVASGGGVITAPDIADPNEKQKNPNEIQITNPIIFDPAMPYKKKEGLTPGSPEAHRDYIEENTYGGFSAYKANQDVRMDEALKNKDYDTIKRLLADSERVGYTLSEPNVTESVPEPTLPDYSWITDMVNNELNQQKTAIEQELARLQQANDLAVQQNNTFLQDSIKRLEENRIKAGAEITNFQNRRGGFYSGGLDYQMGTNNAKFAEAEGNVTRDINARNADIWNRNALLAAQAAENLKLLESQVPARIQQLIAEQQEKDRQAAIQEAGITGMYNGSPTLEANKLAFDQNLATAELGLKTRAADMNETELYARLTGYLPDGRPTSAQQQLALENEWAAAEATGRITATLAELYGIPAGTPTLKAKQIAIDQQNANTSRFSAETSRANADLSKKKLESEQDIRALQAQVIDGIAQFDNAAEASAWLNANAAVITENMGAEAFVEFKKMLSLIFKEDTTAKDNSKIRQEALSMAQKDYRWMDPNQDKEALIQEYVKLIGG